MITIRAPGEKGFVVAQGVTPGCWVDARDVDSGDLERLEREFGISGELLVDIMDTDELSRVEQEDNYTALIVRLPVYNPASEVAYFTVPLGIVLFKDKIVTICQCSSEALNDISSNKIRREVMRNNSAFVLTLLGRAAYTFLKDLKEINKNSLRVELELQKAVRNNELIKLLSLQKSLVYFTTSIKTNELLLEKLQKTSALKLQEEEQDLLDDVVTENTQAMEMTNIYSSILTGTVDAFASVISNNLNIVMKRLAIVNIVLMIPTLIYSFYGMNVPLPFSDSAPAVAAILVFSLAATVVGVILLNLPGAAEITRNSPRKKRRSCCS